MSDEKVRGFFEGAEETSLGGERIPDGTYHLTVVENLGQPDWAVDRDRAVVDLSLEVASGEYAGRYAPRLRLELGGYTWTDKKTGADKEFTPKQAKDKLFTLVKLIHGETPNIPPGEDMVVLDALGDTLVGDEFIARVYTKKGSDYADLGGYRSVNDPPKGFTLARDLEEFRV